MTSHILALYGIPTSECRNIRIDQLMAPVALDVTAQPFIYFKYRHSSWRSWAVNIATLFQPCSIHISVRAETHKLTRQHQMSASFPANEILSIV